MSPSKVLWVKDDRSYCWTPVVTWKLWRQRCAALRIQLKDFILCWLYNNCYASSPMIQIFIWLNRDVEDWVHLGTDVGDVMLSQRHMTELHLAYVKHWEWWETDTSVRAGWWPFLIMWVVSVYRVHSRHGFLAPVTGLLRCVCQHGCLLRMEHGREL